MNRQTAPVGNQAVDFLRTGLPNSGTWVATIVHPAKAGGTMNVFMWWGHILLQVIALGLSCTNAFGMPIFQKKDAACGANEMSCFPYDPEAGYVTIAMTGATCHIIGVVLILVGSAIWEANEYKKMIWFHSILCFCLNFGLVSAVLVWALAAIKYHSLAFWLTSIGLPIHIWSHCMVFSTSAAIGSKNLIRTFVFTMAIAMDLIVALLYQVGTWKQLGTHVQPTWKSLMWVCFGTQLGAQVTLLLGRLFTNGVLNVKTMSTYPFFRSLVLAMLTISAICSTARFGLADSIFASTITSFTLPATIFSWWTLVYAILPSDSFVYPPKADDEDGDEEDAGGDEEEDEEEAVEAAYKRGYKLGRIRGRK